MANDKETKALSGEYDLVKSDNGVLTLTNYRVKYDAAAKGDSKYVSIPLDAVSSCGLVTRSYPVLLLLAVIAGIVALAQPERAFSFVLLALALSFAVAYQTTRAGVITISSNGGENITVPAKGMGRHRIVYFVEAVMQAKLKFTGKIGE